MNPWPIFYTKYISIGVKFQLENVKDHPLICLQKSMSYDILIHIIVSIHVYQTAQLWSFLWYCVYVFPYYDYLLRAQ